MGSIFEGIPCAIVRRLPICCLPSGIRPVRDLWLVQVPKHVYTHMDIHRMHLSGTHPVAGTWRPTNFRNVPSTPVRCSSGHTSHHFDPKTDAKFGQHDICRNTNNNRRASIILGSMETVSSSGRACLDNRPGCKYPRPTRAELYFFCCPRGFRLTFNTAICILPFVCNVAGCRLDVTGGAYSSQSTEVLRWLAEKRPLHL